MSEQAAEPTPTVPANPGERPYKLVGAPVEVNRFDQTLGRVVNGYEVQLQWLNGGTVVTVFVPEGEPLAEAVDQAVRVKGAALDTLQALAG